VTRLRLETATQWLTLSATATQWLAIATGLAAAVLWLRSARPSTSSKFNIIVVKPPAAGSVGSSLDRNVAGHGYSAGLDQLGSDLVRQSRLNAWAAGFTGATMFLQAASMLLFKLIDAL
jgi:hypothetical protein